LLAAAMVLPGGVYALTKEKKDPPEMEMLEFLGTYETADGKMIDPLQFKESPQAAKATAKPAPDRAISKKPEQKKKDGNYD
jgi:hypothetical protein